MFVSNNLMEDMRCKKDTFEAFHLPDDELKKVGYAVDMLKQYMNYYKKGIYTQHISLDK